VLERSRPDPFVIAKLRALSPKQWAGPAGQWFRTTMAKVADFLNKEVRINENLGEVSDLAVKAVEGLATDKHSTSTLNYAKSENERLEAAVRSRTLEYKIREARASVAKIEAEAGIAGIKEIEARLDLFDKLKASGIVPLWDKDRRMTLVRVDEQFDWNGFRAAILSEAKKEVGSGD
jgi:hypothetical protein